MSVVRSACYSGVRVYEVLCRNVPVMRRKVDSYINATQILRAAGLPKPARTKVLERDVVMGVHEKIQGGYAGFQGTWVPLDSAISLAEAHGMLDDLRCLFEYDVASGEAEKNMVARVRRAPVSIIPKEEEPQAGEEYDPSSSESRFHY
ncbi:transcription regulator HTH, apses-type DNA-binding domain-containing protein [Entophlyctis helioformis]|nr:transcription regulator HTH, apses-type DNA-binding domain-containing protein [Entophlyctis helioformis]